MCKTKGADQLISTYVFCYTDSTVPFVLKSEISSLKTASVLCCTAWFVLDLVGNLNCWFSHMKAEILFMVCCLRYYREVTTVISVWRGI